MIRPTAGADILPNVLQIQINTPDFFFLLRNCHLSFLLNEILGNWKTSQMWRLYWTQKCDTIVLTNIDSSSFRSHTRTRLDPASLLAPIHDSTSWKWTSEQMQSTLTIHTQGGNHSTGTRLQDNRLLALLGSCSSDQVFQPVHMAGTFTPIRLSIHRWYHYPNSFFKSHLKISSDINQTF